ncbi:DNA metabolism protein [Lithospermum erythrorhizon]|uniref:DNA metabolism protein n=1 Tax=Lithospermum erythrorhizon TaxID=34254 RepID=A0AAV3NLZ8_LITER
MKKGGRKTCWVPKNNQSSSNSSASVEDQRSSCEPKNVSPCVGSETRGIPLVGSVSKWSGVVTPPNVSYKPFTPAGFQKASSSVDNLRFGDSAPAQVNYSSGGFQSPSSGELVQQTRHLTGDIDKICESSELAISGNKQDQASQERKDMSEYGAPFDICNVKAATVKLKPALHVKNREKRLENKRSSEGPYIKILRPGMVLLKHYISAADQVKIVEKCRTLGLGRGGFYQPSYGIGEGKLRLKMMCLGKNWDSQNSKYIDVSPADGAKTLSIPGEFHKWVDQAIRDSHDYLRTQSVRNIEETLPSMTPDICIVNFYSKTGRLGLHQDKDESKESLRRGLPVVSISIGDSAEFVYGDQRDLEKAEKVVLESGDVLIFGGSSRHIFHGVTTINAETAPKSLLEESNLRPGRLNLTFRQF